MVAQWFQKSIALMALLLVNQPFRSQAQELDYVADALNWMARADHGTDYTSPLFLPYLHRAFGLDYDTELIERAREEASEDLLPFFRMVDEAVVSTQERIDATDRFGWPLLTALYCDRFGLPIDFLNRIEAQSLGTPYELTHAALGLDWAIEMGCLQSDEVAPTITEQNDALVRVVEQVGFSSEATLEAIGILLHRGEQTLVDPEWVDTIRSQQHDDGGWGYGERGSNLHATVLALWVLLHFDHPNAPPTPMIAPAIGRPTE